MKIEPLPYYFDSINRNGIIVRPKKAFYDWINSTFPDEEPISEKLENNIYLIREMENNEKILIWIKRNFDQIFCNELNDWYTSEDKWPQNRSFKMFSDWFDIEICSMILDLEELDINKD